MDSEAAPTNLVALRDGKQQAEAIIAARYAEGIIDEDELERRLERLVDADTLGALEQLIVDLVDPGTEPGTALMLTRPSPGAALARASEVAPVRRMVAVFSKFEQHGSWVPAQVNRVIDVFGEAVLDFREAKLNPGETRIELRCVFSTATLLIPPGLALRGLPVVVFGDVNRDEGIIEEPLSPADPVIVLSGSITCGSLVIRLRLPGESRREARRRRRKQRRRSRRERRKARRRGRRPRRLDGGSKGPAALGPGR